MKTERVDLIDEIQEGLAWLQTALPTLIAGMEISAESKIPFKVLVCRAAFGWRFAELCQSALARLEGGQLVSGVLLTRSAAETCAAVWYLNERIRRSVEQGTLGNADDRLMRMLLGSRIDSELPDPVHINDFIRSVSTQLPEFEEHYNRLSEFAHPNWAGTLFAFSRPEPEERTTHFGPYLRGSESISVQGLVGLSTSLLAFRTVFESIGDLMPAFTKLCESGESHAV